MRVFLCSYGGFSLAIPMDIVSSVFIFNDNADYKFRYDKEKRNTYISLPVLFDFPVSSIHHGIILKNEIYEENEYESLENRVILLSTEIDKEKEIPSEKFYSIPKALKFFKFTSIFTGIFFNPQRVRNNLTSNITAGDMVLLLNPDQLVKNIQKEIEV